MSATRERRLSELAGQLGRWCDGQVQGGRPPCVQGVTKKINGWLRARHMRDLFSVEIGERDGLPTLAHAFNEPAWQQLRTTLLGKTLLFTDNHDWSDADIVRGYCAQHHVEGTFRQMKRPQRSALRPQYHWTDQKIEVREVGLLHPPHGSRRKPRLEMVVSSMSEDQRALYEALDLQRYMDS